MNTNRLPATFAALGLFAISLLGCVTDSSDESDEAPGSQEAGLETELVLTDATAVFAPGSRTESEGRKHVTNFKWTGAKATVGMGMGKGMYQWMTGRRGPGAVSIVGTDATSQRRRLDWQSGRITDFELSDLAASAPPAAIAMTFGEVQLADVSLGVDPAEAEPEALGWRVRVPNVDPSRVRTLRATSFHSDDDGRTWEGAIDIDVQGSACVSVSSDVVVDYLDDRGGWLSSVVFTPKEPSTCVAHGGTVTLHISPDRVTFPMTRAK